MTGIVFRDEPVRVTPGATSANVGPGFDTLGLALTLHDEITAAVADEGLRIEVTGEGAATVPRNEDHLVVRAMRAGFAAMGGQPSGLVVRCHNEIPQARGLGSSAAAIVGGLLAARGLVGHGSQVLDDESLLNLAVGIEGHPDNVAACLLGGLTVAWQGGDPPKCMAVRVEPIAGLSVTVFVPEQELSTATSRGALPECVPHAHAAATVGRAALLMHALTRDPALLMAATEDWLHQSYRAPCMPASADLLRELRANGSAAVLSGAGPSVVVVGDVTVSVSVPPGFRRLELKVADGCL